MDNGHLPEQLILDFWNTDPSNDLHLSAKEKAWDRPQVAIASGADLLFSRIKEMIGPFHWTPAEAFAMAFPECKVTADELRVISYVLPQTSATRSDNRKETCLPAERWARSRYFGEEFNIKLRQHLADKLTGAGYPAVAPERLPEYDYRQSDKCGIASNWSERHAAFVAGHGTFSPL